MKKSLNEAERLEAVEWIKEVTQAKRLEAEEEMFKGFKEKAETMLKEAQGWQAAEEAKLNAAGAN
jgi:hypothetical protein